MQALAIVLFSLGLLLSIMLHEWGHFATARRFGMRADRFFVGFGPTLWSTRRGETEYGVKAFPIGGFVRILGMSPDDDRRGHVADEVLDREAIAELRHRAAERAGVDVTLAPAIPYAVWDRLDDALERRGTPAEERQRIVAGTREGLAEDATVDEAHVRLRQVVLQEVRETGRNGDLFHRLVKGDEDRFFHDRPAWQRAIVLSAGSAMHLLQAAVLIFFILWLSGPVVTFNTVDEVLPDTPAAAAGLQEGDTIVAIDGQEVADFEAIRRTIRDGLGESLTLSVLRDDASLEIEVVPALATDPETGEVLLDEETGQRYGRAGFIPVIDNQPLPVGEAAVRTFVGEGSIPDLTVRTVGMLGQVFGPDGIGAIFSQVSGEEDRGVEGAVSVVGAAGVAAEGASMFGLWITLATLLASINVFIGIFNILPLPPLDGGHLAVLGIEKVVNGARTMTGRAADFSIDPRAVTAVAIPVIVLIGTVSAMLLWLDVVNPVSIR